MSTVPSEEELKANAVAPRVTLEDLEASIKTVDYYIHPQSCLTICIITMVNDFQVTGQSACADPANFNKEIGERFALDNAKKQIWPLLGFQLRQKLHDEVPTTFIERLETEILDLNTRTQKLLAFFGSPAFGNLFESDRNLLYKQKDQMWGLLDTLRERLARIKSIKM